MDKGRIFKVKYLVLKESYIKAFSEEEAKKIAKNIYGDYIEIEATKESEAA